MDAELAKVLKDYVIPEPNSGCWLWTGALTRRGYGWASNGSGGAMLAHRKVYALSGRELSPEYGLDHKCRNHCCVNPDHLEPVTQRENVLRGFAPAAINSRKTHCIHGHPLSGDNLITRPCGRRACRKCQTKRNRSRANATSA